MVESYAHLYAKDVVGAWLRTAALGSYHPNKAEHGSLVWEHNRQHSADRGVWLEYPILEDGTGATASWASISDEWRDAPPTYHQLRDRRMRVGAICDVVLEHQGRIQTAIEITHKHRLTNDKLRFLKCVGIERIADLPASWVLQQVTTCKIPKEFFLDMRAIDASKDS